MDPFSTAPYFVLDLIFLKLNEEDLYGTLRVSTSWFWASIRRMKKLNITRNYNPLKSIAEFYNIHRPKDEEEMDWRDLFKHLVLDELVVDGDDETTTYLVNNGCNTVELTIGGEEVPVTLESFRNITRLRSFEYCTNSDMKWRPFIVECMQSSHCKFDPEELCPIEAIKLNLSGWNPGDPVLKSVTKLGVCNVTIGFLRALVGLCPNLEEVHCFWGDITEDWKEVFPENVTRIELHDFDVDNNVATVVKASTNAGRLLLQYLCKKWKSVEKFHFDGDILHFRGTVYEAFKRQGEEVFVCREFNEEMKLVGEHFQNRKILVGCYDWDALGLSIPSTKSVKIELHVERDFRFSPRVACLEPGKVECFSLSLINWGPATLQLFVPNSFEGFTRLTSLTLSEVSGLTIKVALDQCPSIRKLKLKELKAFTIGSMSRRLSYSNVTELVLKRCEEPMDKVFQVFPRVVKFKQAEGICKVRDWLWRRFIEEDKKYGVLFQSTTEIRYMVSVDLLVSLSEAQKLVNQYLDYESMCYLKGFNLIPRVATQKVIYIS